MLLLVLRLLTAGFYLQGAMCYRSCILSGQKALCSGQRFYRVPALPPNITHLYLDQNHIRELSSASLRDFTELQELDLGYQKVKLVIRNDAFLQQRNLKKLVLGLNVGLQLEPRAFAGLDRLQSLFVDYCGLTDAFLTHSFLQPLRSLETLDLFGNRIVRLQPCLFFSNLTRFTRLDLKLNQIEKICEGDLVGFQGKYFTYLDLSDQLGKTLSKDWLSCGNPFKGIAFNILDLSNNGLSKQQTTELFRDIQGTQIAHLKYSGHIGRGFSHDNLPDPDESTFQGLNSSAISHLDLSGNFIFSLQKAVFKPLKDVVIIDVSRNKINQIDPKAFDGLEGHLRMLNLSFNLLGEIYSQTFRSLTELRVLDLSYNHIGVLGDNAFSELSRLRGLYLTGNSLRGLGRPAALTNVEYLTLGDNKLSSIYNLASLGGNNSTYVDVMDNRLTDLKDVYVILTHFKNLQNLFFGGNFIKWCSPSKNITMPPNNSLKVLDLHDSSLQIIWAQEKCLDVFDHLQNLLGLNISFNSLEVLPPGIFRGLSSVIDMDLSYNALTYLQTDVFPLSLKELDLSNNFLASPDPTTFRSIIFLKLSENRFHCDCELHGFLAWLNVTNVTFTSPTGGFRCQFPADLHGLPLHSFSRIVEPCEQDDENAVKHLKFALFIFSALLVSSVLLSGIAYARLRGHIFIVYKKMVRKIVEGPKPTPPEKQNQYDAFLCFTSSDYGWVEDALLKKLDNQFSEENIFRCCLEARDFLPGEDHLSNIRDAIWDSRKTVCIVSRKFIKDGWCLEAFSLAQGRMLEELKNILIMVVVGKVSRYQLMKVDAIRAFVSRRDYLVWPEDPQDLDWFYERLVSQILKDTKVKEFVEEKPEVEADVEDGMELEDMAAV